MVNLGKITLDKRGESRTINLSKDTQVQPILANLKWDANGSAPQKRGFLASIFGGGQEAADLDLGCMYRLKNGEAGVIQALGGNFGAKSRPPFVLLDKDDRTGAADDGENLTIFRPSDIDLLIIFAFIYDGSADFTQVNGRMTLKDATGSETFMRLSAPSAGETFCVVASVRGQGDSVVVTKEERYFPGHEQADRHFGFGFNWVPGRKD
jgi:tellurite resistance protein TerA